MGPEKTHFTNKAFKTSKTTFEKRHFLNVYHIESVYMFFSFLFSLFALIEPQHSCSKFKPPAVHLSLPASASVDTVQIKTALELKSHSHFNDGQKVPLLLQVLHPVCHVRNLMLWTAVYLPSSSPTTPSDESCAPYPIPGCNPEDAPLGR